MNNFNTQILIEIRNLETLKKEILKSLKTAPEGSLRITKTRGYCSYYLSSPEKKSRYLSKKNTALIEALAQKEYDEALLRETERRLHFLRIAEKFFRPDLTDLHTRLIPARRALLKPRVLTDEEFIRKWRETPYEHKEIRDEEVSGITRRGEKVRSKSEEIIADILDDMGIPYRYEASIRLPDGTVLHPDFTCLNPRTRKVFYWEHLGMTDQRSYMENAVERIRLYMRNGIFPGKNLILTFENERSRPSRPELESMIRSVLL